MQDKDNKRVALLILDGWGLSPSWGGNAINMNNPKNINRLWRSYPHKILRAYDRSISKTGYIGNSEIGHTAISAGRFIKPNFDYINDRILDGSFYENQSLKLSIENCKKHNSSLHLIGMVSDAGIHSHINHLYALLKLAKKAEIHKVFIHMITDGRDTTATEALIYLNKLLDQIKKIGVGEVASVTGRYFAMDKINKWDRISLAYKAIALATGDRGLDPRHVITKAYEKGYTDEYIPPTVIYDSGRPVAKIEDFDSLIFFNYRSDRMQELVSVFMNKKRVVWNGPRLYNLHITTFSDYFYHQFYKGYRVAFKRENIEPNIAQIISNLGSKQIHIAESEKSSHVSFFFDGGRLEPYPNEDWLIIPSLNIYDYAKRPEMSAAKISKAVEKSMTNKNYNFIVANIANVDILGHSGNITATAKAVAEVDRCVGEIAEASLENNVSLIVTADHGNAEQMVRVGSMATDDEIIHTINPVPFILVDKEFRYKNEKNELSNNNMLSDILKSDGTLADIAPTILDLMSLDIPNEMSGTSLIGRME